MGSVVKEAAMTVNCMGRLEKSGTELASVGAVIVSTYLHPPPRVKGAFST